MLPNTTVNFFLGAYLAFMGCAILYKAGVKFWPVVAALVCWGVAAFVIYYAATLSLTLSENGLIYRDWSGSLSVGWDEVEDIVHIPGTWRHSPDDYLRLADGSTAGSWLMRANLGGRINLKQFGGSGWRDDSLGQDLRTCAPQLFDAPDSGTTQPADPASSDTTSI